MHVCSCVRVCICNEMHASVGLCKRHRFLLLLLFAAWKDYCHIIQVDCEQCTYQLMSYSYLLGKQFLFSERVKRCISIVHEMNK